MIEKLKMPTVKIQLSTEEATNLSKYIYKI